MLSSNPAFPAKFGEAFRKRAKRQEAKYLALCVISRHNVGNPLQIRLKRMAQFARVKVAALDVNTFQVDSDS